MRSDSISEKGKGLIRQLGSCKQSLRDRAVREIVTKWIPSQSKVIEEDEMKKLWKGLFYCFWHADKSLYQSQLIEQLTSPLLLSTVHRELAFQYFEVFMLTMRREWSGIDRLRLDKFYLFIRRFVTNVFHFLNVHSFSDFGLLNKVMAVLLFEDKVFGNGVLYHVVSVFFDELRPFLPLKDDVVHALFTPFLALMGRVNDKVLLGKAKTMVFDVLLSMGKRLLEINKSGSADDDDDAALLGTVALKMGFADKFYQLGSADECCQGNRKVVFGLHNEFLKLEKELEASGIDIENNSRLQVPVGSDNVNDVANASADTSLKKCKNKASGEDDKNKSKKKKKNKKKNGDSIAVSDGSLTHQENGNAESENGKTTDHENDGADGITIDFNETVMSNLQVQFEKVAAEAGLASEVASPCEPSDMVNNAAAISKKRKRSKSMDGQRAEKGEQGDAEGSVSTAKSGEKSLKRVRFSMKNNLVWKPQSPLPPQSLRIPPSVTPRGSALKKGVPPGPIREMLPPGAKKVKTRRVVALKNGRKIIKNIPAKRIKKIKPISP